MSKKIVNLDFLDREAQLYKNAKTQIKDNSTIIQKTIDEHTKSEVAEVENAIKKLNCKIDQIMKTDFIKKQQASIESASKQIKKSMEIASNTFFKVKKIIDEYPNLTPEKKKEMEKKLYNKIIDKFMTQEEKDLFNRIMMGNGILLYGGIRSQNIMLQ